MSSAIKAIFAAAIAVFFGAVNFTDSFREIPAALSARIGSMALEQKIGQMMIVGIRGMSPDEAVIEKIEKLHIGGFNLLKRNVADAGQVKNLSSGLQAIASVSGAPPLFIGTDQEGGAVSRFNFISDLTPQSRIADAASGEAIALKRGSELKALGVNMNFAPMADYVSDPQSYLYGRAFRGSRSEVAAIASAMMHGYGVSGVIAVLKHFPGYGNVRPNPHSEGSRLDTDKNDVQANIGVFKNVISSSQVDALMTAHVIISDVDTEPASESYVFITRILRDEIGFNGVVMTDDLDMVSAGSSAGEAAVKAVLAGADMVIISNPALDGAVHASLLKAISDGRISESRIDQSVRRIFKLKNTRLGFKG
ncbi:MAG: hypothetical protein A3B23_03950 [Candidatus Colwellbacteria bacterium RIFCSPLOWO2_01_FULL_48_10]|uniref:beta-N-acetylhexosaminidase n=1 Tax=Candidatus Colwellbacteria bacterium RIFCSPLOWO2_01_FULL_48_10 TaxID=1797690 RepID=A0A1G1Z6G9_9BACT|nr:MAG: hypothetical protein A3B23_03950 [Candidatus Colwellbacteria bacterium RIFCSPLOWO2_01_FULL_48_10]